METAKDRKSATLRRDPVFHRIALFSQPLSALRFGHQLGVVISEQSLRFCLIKRSFSKTHVVDIRTYRPKMTGLDNWPNRISYMVEIIKDYLKEHDLPHIPINIALVSHDIGFRRLTLPEMPKAELSTAVMWEGSKLFPFSFDDCVVSYDIVHRFERDESNYLGINIIAANNAIVKEIYEQFHSERLVMGQINLLPNHLSNLIREDSLLRSFERNLILCLDEEESMAIFVHRGYLEFQQHFVTQPRVGNTEKSIANIEALSDELLSFLDLYNAQAETKSIDSIVLCGSFGGSEEIAQYFSEITRIPCRPLISMESYNSKGGELTPAELNDAVAAVATSLSPAYYHPLTPSDLQTAEDKMQLVWRIGTAAALSVFIAAALQLASYHTEVNLSTQLKGLKTEAVQLENSTGYQVYVALLEKLHRSEAELQQKDNKKESHYNILLKELSVTLPDYITMNSINLRQTDSSCVLDLDGKVILKDFSPEIVLAEYVETLGRSPFLENVKVLSFNKQRQGDNFALMFKLRMDVQV